MKSSIVQLFDFADITKPSNIDRDLRIMVGTRRLNPIEEGFRLHRRELAKVNLEFASRQKN